MTILEDALRVRELYQQICVVDKEDRIHDGTEEGIKKHYTKKILIHEAKYILGFTEENLEFWADDHLMRPILELDKKQLTKFIKKWEFK